MHARVYIYIYEHTAHPKTHKLSTQHVPNFYIPVFESGIFNLQRQEHKSQSDTNTNRQKTKRSQRTAGMQHTTHL